VVVLDVLLFISAFISWTLGAPVWVTIVLLAVAISLGCALLGIDIDPSDFF